jgi:hypothetical protein
VSLYPGAWSEACPYRALIQGPSHPATPAVVLSVSPCTTLCLLHSYAHDELDMATLRMRLRLPGETVAPHEAIYKVGRL